MNQLTAERPGVLPTLEQPGATVPYTDYWKKTFPALLEGAGVFTVAAVDQAARLGSFMSRVSQGLIRELDLSCLNPSPGVVPLQRNPSVATGIHLWNRALGSFNQLESAQGDLLRAAGLLLEGNIDPRRGSFVPVSGNPSDTYKAFGFLFGHNPVEVQRPTPDLLLAAELVHKAAWTETNLGRQARLFSMAEAMYSRLIDGQGPSEERFRAMQYRADIRFHAVGDSLRAAILKTNATKISALEAQAETMVVQQLGEAIQLSDWVVENLQQITPAERNTRHGLLGEATLALCFRARLLEEGIERLALNEIRRAFSHEDQVLSGGSLKPNTSFDFVKQGFDLRGHIYSTTPIQLKLRSPKTISEKRRPVDAASYMPGILTACLEGDLQIRHALKAEREKRQGARYRQQRSNNPFMALTEKIDAVLSAA